jgi:hypothetical protein
LDILEAGFEGKSKDRKETFISDALHAEITIKVKPVQFKL